jgi:hypothetical protein
MLETRIEELTAAIRELISVLPALQVSSAPTSPEVVKEQKAAVKKPKIDDHRDEHVKNSLDDSMWEGGIKTRAEVPNEQTSLESTSSTTDASEPESAPVTYDDVKKATNALSAAKGRDVTIDALSLFGVKRATELDEGQWSDYISYASKVIADSENV